MKKKLFVISFIFTVSICIAIAALYINHIEASKTEEQTVDYSQVDFSNWQKSKLVVNGKVCENVIVRIHPDGYAVIPILGIVKELGGTVTWENEYTAIIKCNNIKYTLNTKENTLVKSGKNYSIFDVLCGKANGVPYFAKEDNDYIVADEWAAPFLSDINVYKRIDTEQNIVYIYTKNT